LKRKSISHNIISSLLAASVLALSACGGVAPKHASAELKQSAPKQFVTSYSEALEQLGLMTEVYGSSVLKVQSQAVGDDTGASGATGGEIQRDISNIVKSTLNSIGGRVIFVPYDPAYVQNQQNSGFKFNMYAPDVVISGGITAFDRGLNTHGAGSDADAGFSPGGALISKLPSSSVEINYSNFEKSSKASISLDFIMTDFSTQMALQKMSVSNKMVVYKAMANEELGLSLFGLNYGNKGSDKKVQGRHEAIRLLVQVSMIQLLGRNMLVPYWRLLGHDARPDKYVVSQIRKSFYSSANKDRISMMQKWLILHGYPIQINGSLDRQTISAIKDFESKYASKYTSIASRGVRINREQSNPVNVDNYTNLYLNIPVNDKAAGIRAQLESGTYNPTLHTSKPALSKRVEAPALTKDLVNTSGPLSVKVWTNKSSYNTGESIAIYLRGNRTFYAKLLYKDASGQNIQLLPNPYHTSDRIEGGVTYEFPSAEDEFTLDVSPPFGTEQIVLYASERPLERLDVEHADSVYLVTTPNDQVDSTVRGVSVNKKNMAKATGGSGVMKSVVKLVTQH